MKLWVACTGLQDEKYDHIEMADMEKVKNATLEKHSWLDKNSGLCNQQPVYADPVVLVSQIYSQREVCSLLNITITSFTSPCVYVTSVLYSSKFYFSKRMKQCA